MTKFARTLAGATAAIALGVATTGATAQTVNPELLEIYAENGYTLDGVHNFATAEMGMVGEIKTLSSGKRYGAYTSREGVKFVTWTDFCQTGPCLGLVFAAYFPGDQYRATQNDLNAFNVIRPHGNASFDSGANTYLVQRLITNIAGVTKGALAGEFGVFEGYSQTFYKYMNDLNAATANKISHSPTAAPTGPEAQTISLSSGNDALGLGDMSTSASEILNDLKLNAPADGVYAIDPVR